MISPGSTIRPARTYNAGVGGSNPSPPTTRTSRSTVIFIIFPDANMCSSGREIQQKSNMRMKSCARFGATRDGNPTNPTGMAWGCRCMIGRLQEASASGSGLRKERSGRPCAGLNPRQVTNRKGTGATSTYVAEARGRGRFPRSPDPLDAMIGGSLTRSVSPRQPPSDISRPGEGGVAR